jgi:hypothetical protein
MRNLLRQLLVYGTFAIIIATVWELGSARATYDRAMDGYYPSAEPELFQRAMNASNDDPKPAANPAASPVASLDTTK